MEISGSVYAIKVTEKPCLEVNSSRVDKKKVVENWAGKLNPSNFDTLESSQHDSLKSSYAAAEQFCSEEPMEARIDGARIDDTNETAECSHGMDREFSFCGPG